MEKKRIYIYNSWRGIVYAKKGKAILVSGRDIRDLENILMYTEAKNIDIYTHGEMLLAHSLPELRKFHNLAGHYGGVSTDQQLEIESFPGPVLITSNCAWNPPQVFRGRIFTTGIPMFMGVQQIVNHADQKSRCFSRTGLCTTNGIMSSQSEF